jgi:hypothetical protein
MALAGSFWPHCHPPSREAVLLCYGFPGPLLRVLLRVKTQKAPMFTRVVTLLRVQTPGEATHPQTDTGKTEGEAAGSGCGALGERALPVAFVSDSLVSSSLVIHSSSCSSCTKPHLAIATPSTRATCAKNPNPPILPTVGRRFLKSVI